MRYIRQKHTDNDCITKCLLMICEELEISEEEIYKAYRDKKISCYSAYGILTCFSNLGCIAKKDLFKHGTNYPIIICLEPYSRPCHYMVVKECNHDDDCIVVNDPLGKHPNYIDRNGENQTYYLKDIIDDVVWGICKGGDRNFDNLLPGYAIEDLSRGIDIPLYKNPLALKQLRDRNIPIKKYIEPMNMGDGYKLMVEWYGKKRI